MRALLFPGQGSQAVGMGKEFYDNFHSAKEVFQEINESLNFDLTKIIFEGPEELLLQTQNAQPAIMACSIAVLKVLEKDFDFSVRDHVSFLAGHSLGEYSALCAAEVFDIKTTANLLKLRGESMNSSSPQGFSGMVAVIGINDITKIQELIDTTKEKDEVCVIANDNCQGQTVVSGHTKSLENLIQKAKEFGARMALRLPVSGSFHSPLMYKSSESIANVLNGLVMKDAIIPIVSNVLATQVSDSNHIRTLLVEQVVSGVRWRESMEYLVKQGVEEVVEIGHGNILTGLMKRISPDIERINVQGIKDIDFFMNLIHSS